MKKGTLITLVASGMLLLAQHGAFAQLRGFQDGLEGSYALQTIGSVVLGPSSGSCAVGNSSPAGLNDGFIRLDGHGKLSGSNLGITLGATTCPSPNYNVSGSYTIQKTGDGTIEATGTFTMSFVGRGAACSGTALVDQPFTIVATTGMPTQTTFTFETSGAGDGSTYAEGPPAGPLTCSAPILNFVTSGGGKKVSN